MAVNRAAEEKQPVSRTQGVIIANREGQMVQGRTAVGTVALLAKP